MFMDMASGNTQRHHRKHADAGALGFHLYSSSNNLKKGFHVFIEVKPP